ncbi:Oxidoreductase FAD-binding family protein [Sorangium cellulosum So ce56]|uniref:Oxidoreductase FAD-binding family protein n=1 Tax=Sorangium cellulosum (strain So ce56) TaxID=448385 RepID=A9GQ71_SORC5|nr:FAD-dependent oxidoreductase [Sorangium cellulosum]CAN90399.1 Oxidoreductase FAD-binding family protein [Sorangium cellulosum So ce56]
MATQGNPKIRIAHATPLGDAARLLRLERVDGAEIGFAGGQYVIINTGVTLPGGRLAKRAYSMLSSDAEQRAVEIAVKRVGAGPGSNVLNDIAVGAELEWSGPWGKLRLAPGFSGRALVIATDTGITAALGIARSAAAAGAAQLDLLWLVEPGETFASEPFVRERLPAAVRLAVARDLPPIGHPERPARACAFVERELAAGPHDAVLCAGDGAILYPLRDHLVSLGAPEGSVLLESFFNNPAKKSL